MTDPIVNATTAPQEPVTAPVTGNADAQAQPSAEVKPELIDFSPLGDSFKDFKVDKKIADKLPGLLKDLSPEEIDNLTDAEVRKLYFQSEKGYRSAHAERFEKEAKAIQAAEAKLKALTDKEQKLLDKEAELAEVEGDAFHYRDPKVKEKTKYANKQVEDGRWTQEEADDYIKPYIDVAKQSYKDRKVQAETELKTLMEGNRRIGKETFPELDPTMAAQLIDGFTVNGSDPKSAAELFRKEFDRVIEYAQAKAVADYVKKLNTKQPDIPVVEPAKMIPNGDPRVERSAEIARGQSLWGTLFGQK